MKLKFLIFSLWFVNTFCFANSVLAEESVWLELKGNQADYNLLDYVGTAEDGTGAWTINDMIAPENQSRFKYSEKNKDLLPANSNWYWMKINLRNTDSDIADWVATSFSTEAGHFNVFILKDGELTNLGDYGYRVAPSKKKYFDTHPRAKFNLSKGEELTLYIQAKFFRVVSNRIDLMSSNATEKHILFDWGFSCLYIGFIVSLVLYNLFLYFRLKDVAYLYYVLFATVMMVNVVGLNGAFDLLEMRSGTFYWIEFSVPFMILISVTASLFCKEFLQLKKRSPKLNMILNGFVALCVAAFVVVLFDNTPGWIDLVDMISNFGVILTIAAGIVVARQGYQPAKIYVWAWGIFVASVLYWMLGQTNIIPATYLNINLPPIGSMIEMALMSFALAQRIKEMQDDKLASTLKIAEGEEKKRLLRVVCHDIANPLSVAEGFSDQLSESLTEQKQIRQMGKVIKAIGMMKDILVSVRKLEGTDSGKLNLTLEPVDLGSVFTSIDFLFADKLKQKDILLNVKFETEDDYHVTASPTAFTHDVMANLISNAIKFSPKNSSIEISVREIHGVTKASEGKAKIVIEISDHGIGIPEKLATKLFDSTAFTTRPGTSGEKGTGFGLPLVKNYIELFKGEILVTSSCETGGGTKSGTTFTLILDGEIGMLNTKQVA